VSDLRPIARDPVAKGCMDVLDLREPVIAWSHCIGLLLRSPARCSSGGVSRGEPGKQWSLLVYA